MPAPAQGPTTMSLSGLVQAFMQEDWMKRKKEDFLTPVMDGRVVVPMTIDKNSGTHAVARYFDSLGIVSCANDDDAPKVYLPDEDVPDAEIQALTATTFESPLCCIRGAVSLGNVAAKVDKVSLFTEASDAIRVHALNTGEKYSLVAFVRGMNVKRSIVGSEVLGNKAPSLTIAPPFSTLYCGGAANFDGIYNTSFHTLAYYEKAANILGNRRVAKVFDGKFYAGFISTAIKAILMRDPEFLDAVKRHESMIKDVKIQGHLCDWGNIRFIETSWPYATEVGAAATTAGEYAAPKAKDSGNVHYASVLGANAAAAMNLGGETVKGIKVKVQDTTVAGTKTTMGYTLPFQSGPMHPDRGINICGAIDKTLVEVPA